MAWAVSHFDTARAATVPIRRAPTITGTTSLVMPNANNGIAKLFD